MTPPHEKLLAKAERSLAAIDRHLAAGDDSDATLLAERAAVVQALEDVENRDFSGAVMGLVSARERR